MKKYDVIFEGGQSRSGSAACNYMLVVVDDVELYAEILIDDDMNEKFYDESCDYNFNVDKFDDYSYPLLKSEILSQAAQEGISSDSLIFPWG